MKFNWRRAFRVIHRDLGYFLIGACLVYALSGLVVTLRSFDIDVVNSRAPFALQLSPELTHDSLLVEYNRHRGELPQASGTFQRRGKDWVKIPGYRATYDSHTGLVSGDKLTPHKSLVFINRLHYNREGQWRYMGLIFALGFLVLTLTGAFMLKGKKGFMRRGIWFMVAGLLLMGLLVYL